MNVSHLLSRRPTTEPKPSEGWTAFSPFLVRIFMLEITLPSSVEIENAKIDVVETVLYDEIDRGACISINSSKQDIKVYIDGVLRESYSTKDTRLFGKTSVGRYLLIELDQEDAGKVLRIEMSTESQFLGIVKQVQYGDKL